MAVREVDRVILDEQKSGRRNSRKSSRRNSKVMMSPASKRVINVEEDNENVTVRASLTPNGMTRVEVIDKNEGVMIDEIDSDET